MRWKSRRSVKVKPVAGWSTVAGNICAPSSWSTWSPPVGHLQYAIDVWWTPFASTRVKWERLHEVWYSTEGQGRPPCPRVITWPSSDISSLVKYSPFHRWTQWVGLVVWASMKHRSQTSPNWRQSLQPDVRSSRLQAHLVFKLSSASRLKRAFIKDDIRDTMCDNKIEIPCMSIKSNKVSTWRLRLTFGFEFAVGWAALEGSVAKDSEQDSSDKKLGENVCFFAGGSTAIGRGVKVKWGPEATELPEVDDPETDVQEASLGLLNEWCACWNSCCSLALAMPKKFQRTAQREQMLSTKGVLVVELKLLQLTKHTFIVEGNRQLYKRSDWCCHVCLFTTLNSRKRSSSLHSINSNAAHDFSKSITPKRFKKAEPGSPEYDDLSPVTITYVAYLPLSQLFSNLDLCRNVSAVNLSRKLSFGAR